MIQAALTDNARDAITYAHNHARNHEHATITPTDLLLGIASTPGLGRDALAQHTSTADLTRAVSRPTHAHPSNTGDVPMDPATTECLEHTVRLAIDRNVHDLDTDLLLEGLLTDRTVARTLTKVGAPPDDLRRTLHAQDAPRKEHNTTANNTPGNTAADVAADGIFGLIFAVFDGL